MIHGRVRATTTVFPWKPLRDTVRMVNLHCRAVLMVEMISAMLTIIAVHA